MLYPQNAEKTLPDSLFQSPTSPYRATPFWAWNCKLDKALLLREIEQMKRMGMGGFHMHSRSGMATDYLSEEFFDLVKACVEKAREENMLAWLYDEDRWPSGAAGGLLTRDHSMRSRQLLITKYPYGTKAPALDDSHHQMGTRTENGRLIAVFTISQDQNGALTGYHVETNAKDIETHDGWYVYVEYAQDNPWYNNQAYVDTLNPEAIRRFIELTHESYKKQVGEDFGGLVPAIFTDEPQFTKKIRLAFAKDRTDIVLPWTGDFADTFEKAYGFDIIEKIPELVWDLPKGKPSQARFYYHDHVSERFSEAFSDQIGAWCEKNGIALTGHMMAEESLQSQTGIVGDVMRSLRSFQIPGIDMLCDRREYTTAKQAQSVARQYGRPGVMSELYGVTNWDFDFRGHKLQGDWQAALGVTVRVPHLTWVSMAGEAKRDYPASIGYQSSWYEEYPLIEDHFARLNTALTRGKSIVRVGVVHPLESYWLKWGPNENTALERAEMDRRFHQIVEWLCFNQIDFDFIAESLLPAQCAKGGNPLAVGEMEYEAVIVPWCDNLRSTTLDRLEDFHQAGGNLILMGEAAKTVDAVESNRAALLAEKAGLIPFDLVPLMRKLEAVRDVDILNAKTGERMNNLLYQMRNDGESQWLFICNGKLPENQDMPGGNALRIKIKGAYQATLYDTLTGKTRQMDESTATETPQGAFTEILTVMFMHDSLLIKLDPCEAKSSAFAYTTFGGNHLPEGKPHTPPMQIELSEPNALLLDIAEFALDGGDWNPPEELLRADNVCREKLGWPLRMSQFAQPWVVPEEPVDHVFRARFAIRSEIDIKGAKLALEQAAVTAIRLNGVKIPSNVDGWYVDESIHTVPLPEIPAGDSVLELDIPIGRRVGAEWCYLLGDFGVRVEGSSATVTKPVRTLSFGDITAQGLPFYGGNIRYQLPLNGLENFTLYAGQYRGALLAVDIDGERRGTIVFAPYGITLNDVPASAKTLGITVFGSRINSFGAVHNCNVSDKWCGPNAWRTKGPAWCYEYRLKPLGLITGISIKV